MKIFVCEKILSASGDGTIKEWDVESGRCLKTTKGTYFDFMATANPRNAGEKLK